MFCNGFDAAEIFGAMLIGATAAERAFLLDDVLSASPHLVMMGGSRSGCPTGVAHLERRRSG